MTAYETPSRPAAEAPAEAGDAYSFAGEPRHPWKVARERFIRHRLAGPSLFVLLFVFGVGFLAKHLAPYGYSEVNIAALSQGPSWAHPFGTDQLGRDYFSRVLYGTGTDAKVVLLVGLLGSLVGIIVGVLGGFYGGLTDNVVMRTTDLLLTVPSLIVVLVAASYIHATTPMKAAVVLACVLWAPVARVVRGTCLSLREKEYVDAARALGATDARIIRRHILPNAIGPIAVAASLMTGTAVLIETTLSFLGFGIAWYSQTQERTPSLGDVIAEAQKEGLFHWWGIVFPGLAIVLIVVTINFIGDGLRDALDPNQRRPVRRRPPRSRRLFAPITRRLAQVPVAQTAVTVSKNATATLTRRVKEVEWGAPLRPVSAVAGSIIGALDGALRQASRRRKSRRRGTQLLLEGGLILGLTAVAAAAIYVWKGPKRTESSWPLAATYVQDVSRAPGAQTEIALSAAPSDPRRLFAASNDSSLRTLRIMTSTDGGRSWSSVAGPPLGPDACARGEPTVAVDAGGREYVAFIASAFCSDQDPSPHLIVASRASPSSQWIVRRISRSFSDSWDDKPALAVALDGTVYIAWSRLLSWTYETTVVSATTDRGRTWSHPHIVDRNLRYPQLVTASVDSKGNLYLAGVDAKLGIWIARSADRARHFEVQRAAPLPGNTAASCATASNHPIPQQATRCLGPNPALIATRQRVFVVYAVAGKRHSVRVAVFDPSLHKLWRGDVGADLVNGDRFWPVASFDSATKRLWACFYDTSGDSSRQKAWFTCTSSRDGRSWSKPLRASRDPANAQVLWEDARIYGFGDVIAFGGYPAVVATNGVVHALWIDTRNVGKRDQEIFGGVLETGPTLPR